MEMKGLRTQVPVVSPAWVGFRGEFSRTVPCSRSTSCCYSGAVITGEGLPLETPDALNQRRPANSLGVNNHAFIFSKGKQILLLKALPW